MKTFTASRISDGNGMFPCKIIVSGHKITVRIPGLFHNKDKDIPFDKISEVSVDTPLVGYSTITFYTTGVGVVAAHGFTKSEVKEIKSLIESANDEDESDESATSDEDEEVPVRPTRPRKVESDEDYYQESREEVNSEVDLDVPAKRKKRSDDSIKMDPEKEEDKIFSRKCNVNYDPNIPSTWPTSSQVLNLIDKFMPEMNGMIDTKLLAFRILKDQHEKDPNVVMDFWSLRKAVEICNYDSSDYAVMKNRIIQQCRISK